MVEGAGTRGGARSISVRRAAVPVSDPLIAALRAERAGGRRAGPATAGQQDRLPEAERRIVPGGRHATDPRHRIGRRVERAVPSAVLSRRSGFGAGRHGARFAGTDDPAVPEGRTERDAGAAERAVRRRDRALRDRTLGMAGHACRSACGTRPARPGGIRSQRTDCRAVAGAGKRQCDFLREALDDRFVNDVAPDHAHAPDAAAAHRGRLGDRR